MSVPDAIFAVGGLVFAVNLVPTVLLQRRLRSTTISLSTALTTAATLTAFLAAYADLHLWLSLAAGFCTAASWWALTWQARAYPRVTSV